MDSNDNIMIPSTVFSSYKVVTGTVYIFFHSLEDVYHLLKLRKTVREVF